MSTALIEAVARAIFNASVLCAGRQTLWLDDWPDDETKKEARDIARAALAAIEASGTHVVVPIGKGTP